MEKEYKQNQNLIKRLCFRYSKNYGIDFYDLLSYCNEVFIKIYNRYTYNKLPFEKYLFIQLHNYLKTHCKKLLLNREREQMIRIRNNLYFYEDHYKEKKELKGLSKQILEFCINPDNYDKLKQYNKNKYEKHEISKRRVQNYFVDNFNCKIFRLWKAFEEIKLYLKEDWI